MTRKAWHHTHQSRHARGYGYQWTKTRERIISRDLGLCQPCKRNGRPTPFDAVDHIKPKAEGGTDHDDNLECICGPCHEAKTVAEAARAQDALRNEGKRSIGLDGWPVEPKQWGYSIPHGMRPSAAKVYLVVGPPASGKTTHVRDNAGQRDKVIDLDVIKVRLGGKPYDTDTGINARAMRYRDMMIRGLADEPGLTAWLIVTASTKAERAAWLDALGPMAELIEVYAPPDVCAARINADPARNAMASKLIEVATKWEV